jgi:hypothetical protein
MWSQSYRILDHARLHQMQVCQHHKLERNISGKYIWKQNVQCVIHNDKYNSNKS